MIRVRLSPSPTGPLHIGTARTALFNWLYARQRGGTFILRIEDTDRERSKPEFEQSIVELLRWLGLSWDEGPDRGGPFAPYRQSERARIYRQALEKLRDWQRIYQCFCTPVELDAERKAQELRKLPPRYSGRCRHLLPADIAQRRSVGERGVWRFKLPEEIRELSWDDMIRGLVTVSTKELDDFIIAKSFDEALYNFAVVVDDAAMEITHVIRGEDHISNTPKQLLLQEALGLAHPNYGHIPLILNPDRSKMSKRKGNVDLEYYRAHGYLPEAIVNFLVLLGWSPGDDREIFSLENLVSQFSMERVHKGGAVFSLTKLQWVNGQYIRALSADVLLERLEPHIPEPYRSDQRNGEIFLLLRDRMKTLADFWELACYFYEAPEDYPAERLIWKLKPQTKEAQVAETRSALEALLLWIRTENFQWGSMMLEAQVKRWLQDGNRATGQTLWPFRVALSGREASASPFEIAGVLGKAETLRRLEAAIKKLST